MKIRAVILACAVVFVMSVSAAQACTLFSAAGPDWVQGGGSLIVKNRDWVPQVQDIRLQQNSTGYRYYGIFAIDNGKPSLKGGINEKGLVAVSATAGTIPKAKLKAMPRYKGGTLKTLLSKHATVDEAIKDSALFLGPQYIMLADRNKVAFVEIGPEGKHAVQETASGALCHTNHYVDDSMLWANMRKPAQSSQTRYERICQLVQQGSWPYTLDDFIKFSNDKNDGPNNSIWRDGLSDKATQTIAVLIIHLPPGGSPVMYVKLRRNPEDKGREEIHRINIDEVFVVSR